MIASKRVLLASSIVVLINVITIGSAGACAGAPCPVVYICYAKMCNELDHDDAVNNFIWCVNEEPPECCMFDWDDCYAAPLGSHCTDPMWKSVVLCEYRKPCP